MLVTLTRLTVSDNMDEKIDIFCTKLLNIFNAHVPLKRRYFKNLPALWLTDGIHMVMRDRDLARRTTQNLVRSAKREYYVNIFNREGKASEVWGRQVLRHLGLIKARDIGERLSHSALERLVCAQICVYLEDTGLYDPRQSAYRNNHSTQTCLIRMLDEVRCAADRRMVTVSVFFDFSKAFDRVDHFLLEKLKNLNFSENVLRWIHSYLIERTQAVKDCIEGTISSPSPVRIEVPQGSVLGPLLFTLYLADFSHVVKHCKYNFYVDDLQAYIHCESRDLSDTIRKVNEDIDAILGWSSTNRLILNSDKTQAIIMGTSRFVKVIGLSTLPEIRVDGSMIQYSTSVKYLGVTIMNTLSWEKQFTNMTNRIHSALYQLKLCRHLLPETLKSKLVILLIYPHVDYCCAAYMDMITEQNLRLHKAVNACVRFICNVRTDEHITPYYVRLRLLHSNFNCKIATSDYATRAPKDMLFLPKCRIELYKRSFRHIG
ncbi:hypothetical protein ACFW04_014665 [Cataglyphis niger]